MPNLTLNNRLSVWAAGIALGARVMRRWPAFGLARLAAPASYWRIAEFAYVARMLQPLPRGARVLDVGSPKDLACMLSMYRGLSITATNILEQEVENGRRMNEALGIPFQGETQDARALSYRDDTFDAVYSVSVLEHIPGDGDSNAIAEMVRVVKPGGRLVITVPYAASHKETWVDHDVYERARGADEKVFYQRHYDHSTLEARLLSVDRAKALDVAIWGESLLRGERVIERLEPLRTPVISIPLTGPIQPLASMICLWPNAKHPMASFATLEKTAQP